MFLGLSCCLLSLSFGTGTVRMVYVYVLKLQDGKYYVGKTIDPLNRIIAHFNEIGSTWTRKYPVIGLHELLPDCDPFDEDKVTLKYMHRYGIDNVRGGSFCQIDLDAQCANVIGRMLHGSTDKCYKCGRDGHFVNDCDKLSVGLDVKTKESVYKKRIFDDNEKANMYESLPQKDDLSLWTKSSLGHILYDPWVWKLDKYNERGYYKYSINYKPFLQDRPTGHNAICLMTNILVPDKMSVTPEEYLCLILKLIGYTDKDKIPENSKQIVDKFNGFHENYRKHTMSRQCLHLGFRRIDPDILHLT